MEASPLTQQTRPEFLQPKIVGLYETLFREDESVEKPRDIIVVLAGLDDVDVVFTEFVSVLDAVIRNGRNVGVRQKAVKAAMSITSGAYQTGLVSYLTHRDLFPSLMKAFEPFVLLGLLANYNKFEFQNPYRLRLEDFVNDATIRKLVHSFGFTCVVARNKYIAVQDDLPEGWKISNTLSYIGLGALSGGKPATPVLNEDEAKDLFTALARGGDVVVRSLPEMSALINSLVNLIALSLSTGESFLPDPASYDDLLYKLVESGDVLFKFKDAYELSKHSSSSSIDTLVSVSSHYYALLEGEKGKVKSKNLSLREVSKVIKQG
ncbi:hypothetical protein B0A49_09598, partial [Cryomyces minteri]